VAALETYSDLLRPDAVVFCPTVNDINSSQTVLPNGSLGHAGQLVDDFGSPVALELRSRVFDSYLFRRRWQHAMSALTRCEIRLKERGVPTVVLFTGPWVPSLAHRLAADASLSSPYVVTPLELTEPGWLNPPPWRHPNQEAHEVFARMVYRALAPELDWAALTESGEGAEIQVHRVGESSLDWRGESDRALRAQTNRFLSQDYLPTEAGRAQLGCGIDPQTGVMGQTGAVFLRRREGSTVLVLEMRRVVDGSSVYPLGVVVTVPSPSGGTSKRVILEAGGRSDQRFAIPLPSDLGSAAAVDVLLEAERVGVDPSAAVPWSLVVVRVSQEP
jgi:hypothetical protein